MTLRSALYDRVARFSRLLPHSRGKWQLVGAIDQLLLPVRRGADPLSTVRMKDGSLLMWDLRDPAERRAAWLGDWDDAIRATIMARLPRNAVMLDVGASVGAWTVPLARRIGIGGQVVAFEPVPANRARLERAIAANALQNVTVSSLALGDMARTVDLWLRASNTGADSLPSLTSTGCRHTNSPLPMARHGRANTTTKCWAGIGGTEPGTASRSRPATPCWRPPNEPAGLHPIRQVADETPR